LKADVDGKTAYAYKTAQDEFDDRLYPAASKLIQNIRPYEGSMYRLPAAVGKRLGELSYFDDPSYLRQKEMFLTYGGRNFCYYPYYNIKNVVHSSYQVHPFIWNFIKRDDIYGIATNTFFSVNVDELEYENIIQNWKNFFGDFGETKYGDLSKKRYPDYSGYQSRYENSNHVAENTQFVSEVVDYDGAFYPPAVQWIRDNGLDVAVASLSACKYNQNLAIDARAAVEKLDSLEWSKVSPIIESMSIYKGMASTQRLSAELFGELYDGKPLSSVTKYGLCRSISQHLSSDDTFYGRFYRQLRLDQDQRADDRMYIVNQLNEYWNHRGAHGGGPDIDNITKNRQIDQVYDIYRYGIDSDGNMYCLYKQYDQDAFLSAYEQGGLSYRYKQNTPGELWIRFKNHPLAFPAFSGSRPNVYLQSKAKRHAAFMNLFGLDENASRITVPSISATCIYDFEFSRAGDDITFVTKMRDQQLVCDSDDIQCYQNSWLVHCRPYTATERLEDGQTRTVFSLYAPDAETDYFKSGDDYLKNPRLSSEDALDGEGCTLYQYIGSYQKGDNGMYHVYAEKRVYRDEIGHVEREITGRIKILPAINGVYNTINDIFGDL